MALLNYTTKISAPRTVGEIQGILAEHGAKAILIEYDGEQQISALSFKADTPRGEIAIRLPVNPDAVLKVLGRQKLRSQVRLDHAQAVRIAWRIVKDWVEAQMAILSTEMVKLDQIFLPYIMIEGKTTLYDAFADSKFQLTEGKELQEKYDQS